MDLPHRLRSLLAGWLPGPLRSRAESAARPFALVIVGAAAPLAPTSYARARLLRQLHATGLLRDGDAATALDGPRPILELEPGPDFRGAP